MEDDFNAFLEDALTALIWGTGSLLAELLSSTEEQYAILVQRVRRSDRPERALEEGLRELQVNATRSMQSARATAENRIKQAHAEAYRSISKDVQLATPSFDPTSIDVDPYKRRGLDATAPRFVRKALEDGIEPLRRTLPTIKAQVSENEYSKALGRLLERGADAKTEVDLGIGTGPHVFGNLERMGETELSAVVDETSKQVAAKNPAIDLLEWTLSPAHGGRHAPDACDLFAQEDLHGFGGGLYHPSYIPSQPHPRCKCSVVAVLKSPENWGTRRPAPDRPAIEPQALKSRMKQYSGDRTVTDAHAEKQAKEMRDVIGLVHESPRG